MQQLLQRGAEKLQRQEVIPTSDHQTGFHLPQQPIRNQNSPLEQGLLSISFITSRLFVVSVFSEMKLVFQVL